MSVRMDKFKGRKHYRKRLSLQKYKNSIPIDDLYYPSTKEGKHQRELDEAEVKYSAYQRKILFFERSKKYYNMQKYNSSAHILLNGLKNKGINIPSDVEKKLSEYIIIFLDYGRDCEWDIPINNSDCDSLCFISMVTSNYKKLKV